VDKPRARPCKTAQGFVFTHHVDLVENMEGTNATPSEVRPILHMYLQKIIWVGGRRVFRHITSPVNVVIARIKDEAKSLCLAGAKFFSTVIPGE
jgi:hypothetical protein